MPDSLLVIERRMKDEEQYGAAQVIVVASAHWRRTKRPGLNPENPMDREAWQAIVHKVSKKQTHNDIIVL